MSYVTPVVVVMAIMGFATIAVLQRDVGNFTRTALHKAKSFFWIAVLTSCTGFIISLGVLPIAWPFIVRQVLIKSVGFGPFTSSKAVPPEGIDQINETLWSLKSVSEIPQVVIIFFHGLQLDNSQDAFWRTWVARNDEEVIWPREVLGNRLPQAQILSVAYNTSVRTKNGDISLSRLVEILVEDIITYKENIGQNSPIVLVGHSFGGLIMKQFLLSARTMSTRVRTNSFDSEKKDLRDNFLKNVRGLFYYSTCHGGMKMADFVRLLPRVSPMLELVRSVDSQRVRINKEFRILSKHKDFDHIKSFGICEKRRTTFFKLPYDIWKCRFMVVEEESSDHVDQHYVDTSADHFTICRPILSTEKNEKATIIIKDKSKHVVFSKLVTFIANLKDLDVIKDTITIDNWDDIR